MNLTFTDSRGIDRSFPVPQEFEALLRTQAVQHAISTQQALLLSVASGRVIVTETTETVTSPREMAEGLRSALQVLLSPEGQKAFMRRVYAEHNGGPISVSGEKPGSIRFSWSDGRFFEGVPQDRDVTVFIDDEGHTVTYDELKQGTSPHIKKGPPPDLGPLSD